MNNNDYDNYNNYDDHNNYDNYDNNVFGIKDNSSSYTGVESNTKVTSQTNIFAILGLVFSFIDTPIGLIFSIIGYIKSKKLDGSGKNLALAGIIIFIIKLIFLAFLLLYVHNLAVNKNLRTNCYYAYDCECEEGSDFCTCLYLDENNENVTILCPQD